MLRMRIQSQTELKSNLLESKFQTRPGFLLRKLLLMALMVSSFFASGISAHAMDMTWDGLYRVEGISIQNPALNKDMQLDKSYILNHAILQPKIVAMDGLNLYGRIEIFNNAAYPNTQLGDYLGGSPATGGAGGPGTTGVNTQTQSTEAVQISQFYLKWTNEFGALIVGRTPLHFGLGITHNAGTGEFDHYFDTHDIVGYKVIAGNLSFFPMVGKVKEGRTDEEDDINDYMFQFLYENPDTELTLGAFYDVKIANKVANSSTTDGAAIGTPYGGTGAYKNGSYQTNTLNLYVGRNIGNFRMGFETSFSNGHSGVRDVKDREVALDGYALAADISYVPAGQWSFNLKTGLATGDDPNTADKYEGYFFDRNYNIGWLLFNHKLGSYDVLGTKYFRNRTAGQDDHHTADTEYLTNALYISPAAKWQFAEVWNLNTRFVWAQLQRTQPIIVNDTTVTRDLGVEWDLGLGYHPNKNLTLELGAGMLFPGEAFKGGYANLPFDFGYGLQSKAAVRF